MVLFMARPTTRAGSRKAQFQRRVPAAVLKVARGQRVALSLPPEKVGGEPVRITVTLGPTLRFSLRTDDKALRDMRHAAVIQQLETAYAALLAGPRRISLKECYELAGILYHDLNASFEDEPVDANWWRIVAEVAARVLNPPPGPSLMIEAYPGEAQLVELERYAGPLLDAILLREGVNAHPEDRPRLLRAFAERLVGVANKLKRNAEGDFSDDLTAAQIPKWRGHIPQVAQIPSALTFDELLRRWKVENTRSASSIGAWQTAVADLKAHLEHNDPRRVAKSDVVAWAAALRERPLSPKTINDTYLAAIRALYNLALRHDLVSVNPADGYRIPSKRRAGEKKLPYDDGEVAAILALADKETTARLRWIPWLLALTGARVGEIAQLWGKRVTEKDGIPIIRIAPAEDGGSLKNEDSERDVPLHPALIDRGFLNFVKTRPNGGPLFYGGKDAKPAAPRKSETSRHVSTYVIRDVQEWIRENGFTNARKSPNHAFRHWFETKCTKLGIVEAVRDAIQGRTGAGSSADYQHIRDDMAALYEAICKIPVPKPSGEPSKPGVSSSARSQGDAQSTAQSQGSAQRDGPSDTSIGGQS